MKKRHTALALLLVLLLLTACLTSCSAPRKESNQSSDAVYEEMPAAEPSMPAEAFEENYKAEAPAAKDEIATTSQAVGMNAEAVEGFSDKIIYTGHVSLQTTAFDEAVSALEQAVQAQGGFVQDSSVQGYTETYADGTTAVVDRWANYTVRIPADKFDNFMAMTEGIGNVTNSSRTAENVTSQYTDYEAHLSSLRIQEERLLAMLEQSGDLESLITLESRLSDVRYEIESIERNLRNLDQRLAYSTVYLDMQEVALYTPTVAVVRTFGEKLSDAFSDGWTGFVRSIQNLCIGLASSLPVLVLLALLAVAVILTVRKIRRKRRVPPAAPKSEEKDGQ